MSRTDKTRPWWVKAQDRASYLVEQHDHSTGECDLPAERRLVPGRRRTRCVWMESRAFYADRSASTCGCAMCTGAVGRRVDRRRSRHEARRQLRR